MYADCLLPDVCYLERWGAPGAPPTILTECSKIRQPLVKAYPNTKLLEEMLLMMAEKLKLPGFGDEGFEPGMPLKKPEDWHLKIAANFALGMKSIQRYQGRLKRNKSSTSWTGADVSRITAQHTKGIT